MKKIVVSVLALVVLILTACNQKVPTWQEQYDLGVRYLSEGNYEEAIIAFTAAIEIDAKQALGFSGRGQAYALSSNRVDNLTAARSDFERAIELDENIVEAWLGLANVYVLQGDNEAALRLLQEAQDKLGSNSDISEKIAELESQLNPPDDEPTDELSQVTSVEGTLNLSNVSSVYHSGGDITTMPGNEGAVGGMTIGFTVNGPSNVNDVYIGTWFLDQAPSQNEINDSVAMMERVWKEESSIAGYTKTPPFEVYQGHPVAPEDLGHIAYVILIGLDKEMNAVGYALITESIPAG